MRAKFMSLIFAMAALAGAVIYAQNKAEKTGKGKPVFESSKIGTPTPIEEEPVKQKPAQNKKEKKPDAAQNSQQNEEDDKVIMPSSKSFTPPPKKKK
jgi:hypothetical protein